MTDDTDSYDRPSDDERGTGGHVSLFALLLAALLLVGTAVALVVADAETANAVATLAYWALAAGVAFRLAEYVKLGERTRRVAGRARTRTSRALSRWPAARSRVSRIATRIRLGARRATTAVRTHPVLDADLEDGIRLSVPLTVVVGAALVGWWWFDPGRTVSTWFLAGWAVAIIGQIWLSVVVPGLRRA